MRIPAHFLRPIIDAPVTLDDIDLLILDHAHLPIRLEDELVEVLGTLQRRGCRLIVAAGTAPADLPVGDSLRAVVSAGEIVKVGALDPPWTLGLRTPARLGRALGG